MAIHVDAVVARTFDRGRRDPEVDLGGARLEEQLDQLAAGVTAHDGVVHHDHPVAFDHARQRVADRCHHPRVGDRDDHVGLGRRILRQDLAHPVPGACDLATVEARVGTGEVHVLEDAQSAARGLCPVARHTLVVYNDDLAGLHIAQEPGADDVQAARLAGDGVTTLDFADAEGAEAMRVPKCDEFVTEDHGHRVSAFEMAHRTPDRLTDREPTLQLPHGRGRYEGRVRGRVEPEAVLGQIIPQLFGVYEVAVVGHGDVYVAATAELGLGVLPGGGSRRRVADVAEGQVSGLEGGEARSVEDLRDEAHVSHRGRALAVGDGDTRRLLTPVLQGVEAEVRSLGQLPRELAGVESEDAARLLRLAFRIPVVYVKRTHRLRLPSLRYSMRPPSGT